ncbi:MAG: hypothetical protein VZR24_20230 [Butyrivibrio hungatei]|nr:hypothetical protein [Butyrivibrio hungatei]
MSVLETDSAVRKKGNIAALLDSKLILFVFFAIFLLVNGYLIVIHEPWRDEVQAWFLAKFKSVPGLIEFSRFDGHPILWHLILLPFAKLGAPIWTMHVISYVCVSVSAYLFLFKTKLNSIAKIVCLFSIPFLYLYSSVSRNYCLVLLVGMLICVLYGKRYEHPFIYSLLITLMIYTHALAWGFVAGLTITFHIYEIVLRIMHKSKLDKKSFMHLIAGLALIVISTFVVVFTLYGSSNPVYVSKDEDYVNKVVLSLLFLILASVVVLIISRFKLWKETVVFVLTMAFKIVIYKWYYSGILFQRLLLIQVFLLFFVLMVKSCGKEVKKMIMIILTALYFVSFFFNGAISELYSLIADDINWNYSSGREMAEYLNSNLPDEKEILVDGSTYVKSIMPYTDKRFFDISQGVYKEETLFVTNDFDVIIKGLKGIDEHSEYKGHYLICFYQLDNLPYEEVYRTSNSIMHENFILYYIPD